MCYQKRRLNEYTKGIHSILSQKKMITGNYSNFIESWHNSAYNKGIASIGLQLIYFTMFDQNSLAKYSDVLRLNFGGDFEFLLKSNGWVTGNVKKPTKGIAALGWEMLEKLQCNDLQYFEELQNEIFDIQEKI